MKLYTDDYFHIGASHLGGGIPCQDYALSRALEDGSMAYAIVSDGCSTGGRTDVGSRIIVHTADVAIRDLWKRRSDHIVGGAEKEIDLHQQVLLTGAKVQLGVEQRDLLATCMYAIVSKKGVIVHVRGDGVIAIVRRNGSISLRRYDWSQNMPLYPAYFEDNFRAFAQAHGTEDTKSALIEEVWDISPNASCERVFAEKHEINVGIDGITIRMGGVALQNEISFVCLFTDGVTQVDGVDWKDAVLSLVSFKSTAGSFAKRRMISFIKDAQKKGKGPLDDIAYAVIRVGTEEEKENG